MKTKHKDRICGLIGWYIGISLFAVILGLLRPHSGKDNPCDTPKTRIGYVMPAFSIGCWLSEVPGED